MVTFKTIYEDAMSTFPGDIRNFDPVSLQNWINESYIEIRDQYIQANKFDQFAISDHVKFTRDDRQLPYLRVGTLRYPILQHLNFDSLVVYVIARKHDPLKDEAQTWSEGDYAWKGIDKFVAVNDITGINTYTLTFENRDVRNYAPANGLKYKIGNVVKEDGKYYRANSVTVNTASTALSTRSEWDQVYWKYDGMGFTDPEVINFNLIDRRKAAIDNGATVITFDKKEVYISSGVTSAEIRYVPEHKWVTKNNETFYIPDSAKTIWRNLIHEKMLRNRGQVNTDAE